jgi:hypothetical protein
MSNIPDLNKRYGGNRPYQPPPRTPPPEPERLESSATAVIGGIVGAIVGGLVYSSGSEYGICIAATIITGASNGGLIGAWYGSSEASWRNTGLDLLLSTVLGGIGGVLAQLWMDLYIAVVVNTVYVLLSR